MTGQQEGPVEQGTAPVVHMDLDLALSVLADSPHDVQAELDALQVLVDRARQYVAGPTSGRLAALCQVLQEPAPDTEAIVRAWLTERDMIVVTREAAARLGIGGLR